VHFLSSAPVDSAWTFGASILTFAFPMILFIAVGGALWVLYTKPELVPGRPAGDIERPVSYTPLPQQPAAVAGQATTTQVAAAGPAVAAGPAIASEDHAAAATGDGTATTPEQDGDAAATEDGA
jgi:hypothetical protein